jgi:hypothetical protein
MSLWNVHRLVSLLRRRRRIRRIKTMARKARRTREPMTDPTMTGALLRCGVELVPLGFEEAEGSIDAEAVADAEGPAIARTLLLVPRVLPEPSTAMTS